MPSPSKSNRRGHENKNSRMGKLIKKSASFHGQAPEIQAQLRRPKTVPDLLSGGRNLSAGTSPEIRPRLTKLLLNVTIQRSLGPVQVVMSPESSVGDLIAAAVKLYGKEGRRPFLDTNDTSCFDLHYSQFSLESLNREEKLMELGSRNFFLCTKKPMEADTTSSSSCSNQAKKDAKVTNPWLRLMEFLS